MRPSAVLLPPPSAKDLKYIPILPSPAPNRRPLAGRNAFSTSGGWLRPGRTQSLPTWPAFATPFPYPFVNEGRLSVDRQTPPATVNLGGGMSSRTGAAFCPASNLSTMVSRFGRFLIFVANTLEGAIAFMCDLIRFRPRRWRTTFYRTATRRASVPRLTYQRIPTAPSCFSPLPSGERWSAGSSPESSTTELVPEKEIVRPEGRSRPKPAQRHTFIVIGRIPSTSSPTGQRSATPESALLLSPSHWACRSRGVPSGGGRRRRLRRR